MEKHDVVILGAGPAGTACSLFLSKENIPHVIIDKATFPRDKVCGDAISGKVVSVMNKLDPAMLQEIIRKEDEYMPSYGVTFIAPNGHALEIPFATDISKLEHAPGFISQRMNYDNFLFEHLDPNTADIRTDCKVDNVQLVDGGVEINYSKDSEAVSILAKIVIGAEGDRSLVAKNLSDIRKENDHYCAGVRAYYSGVEDLDENGFIELHFTKQALPGYFWIFPLPNGYANVGLGMLSSAVSKKNVKIRQLMEDIIANDPGLSPRFKNAKLESKIDGWGLPLGSKKRTISGDHFILTGDAASLIDPFTGEGIGNAMLSAMVAVKYIKKALAENKFDAQSLNAYDVEIYNKIGKELKISRTLQKLIHFPWLFNFVVDKARKNETLQKTFIAMFENIDIRNKLQDPRFYLKLLFN
ncbi:MAG: geranylgeranyl reductase family protein [Bacteroidetes bacterium]|nr:geranylgeranyl reductase family protein [Bacteroidota bacterium]